MEDVTADVMAKMQAGYTAFQAGDYDTAINCYGHAARACGGRQSLRPYAGVSLSNRCVSANVSHGETIVWPLVVADGKCGRASAHILVRSCVTNQGGRLHPAGSARRHLIGSKRLRKGS